MILLKKYQVFFQHGQDTEQKILSKYLKSVLSLSVQVENGYLLISDFDSIAFRQKYDDEYIQPEISAVVLGEVQIRTLEMQGKLNDDWFSTISK